jgi:hypothetical protein
MTIESLVMLILVIALIGFLIYLIVTYIPMPELFRNLIIVLCVIVFVLYLLGLLSGNASLPRLR